MNQDINFDPEFNELCETCGVTGVRLFLEIMSMLEKTENHVKVGGKFLGSFKGRVGGNKRTIKRAFCFFLEKNWISFAKVSGKFQESFGKVLENIDETLEELSQNNGFIYAPNYVKYRGNRVHENGMKNTLHPPLLDLPLLDLPKKEKKEKNSIKKPCDVTEEVWQDFLAVRKSKKAPVTATAIKRLIGEGEKAGLTLQQVLEKCCQNGWQGFSADWVVNNGRAQQPKGLQVVADESPEARKKRLMREAY